MANQWGRDSDLRSGGKRGNAALSVIAVILSLALGAAGGYAAFRFTQPDINATLEDARAQAAGLSDELAAVRKELSEARADQASSAAQADDFMAKTARQARELDAMAETLAAITSEAQTPEDGSAAVKALTRERDALAADNQTLKASLAELEAEGRAFRQDARAAEELITDELARLQNEVLPQVTADRDRLQRQAEVLLADKTALEGRLNAVSEEKASDAVRIAELEARLEATGHRLTVSQEALEAIKVRNSEVIAGENAATAADSQRGEPAVNPNREEEPALDRRNTDAVAAALRAAPGLETLSDDELQKLTDKLMAGECVTTALESVFDRVPILTLRNLIRDLNSGC